jgi:hypothetical protein
MPKTNKRNKQKTQTKPTRRNPRESTSNKERKPKWVASGGIKRSIWIGTNRKNQVEGRKKERVGKEKRQKKKKTMLSSVVHKSVLNIEVGR